MDNHSKKLVWKHRRSKKISELFREESNGGDFAVPEGHGYRKHQE